MEFEAHSDKANVTMKLPDDFPTPPETFRLIINDDGRVFVYGWPELVNLIMGNKC